MCVCVCGWAGGWVGVGPLLRASGWIRDARGYVGVLTSAWGLGILVSAPCTAERRPLASDMLCLSCLMTN